MIQSAAEQCLQCTSKRGAWVSPGFSSHPLLPCSHNDRVRKQITHAHKPHWDNYFVCRDPQGNSSRSWLIWIYFPAPLLLWSCTTYRNHSNAPEVYHRPSVDKLHISQCMEGLCLPVTACPSFSFCLWFKIQATHWPARGQPLKRVQGGSQAHRHTAEALFWSCLLARQTLKHCFCWTNCNCPARRDLVPAG